MEIWIALAMAGALFDDPGSDFTAMKSAAHRDFVADYVAAVRKAGLRVGLYYSPLDWRYPGFFFPDFFFPDFYRASADQLREQYHRQLNPRATQTLPRPPAILKRENSSSPF